MTTQWPREETVQKVQWSANLGMEKTVNCCLKVATSPQANLFRKHNEISMSVDRRTGESTSDAEVCSKLFTSESFVRVGQLRMSLLPA